MRQKFTRPQDRLGRPIATPVLADDELPSANESELAYLQNLYNNLAEDYDALQKEVGEYSQLSKHYIDLSKQLQHNYDEIVTSRFWKITRPVRAVWNAFRYVFSRVKRFFAFMLRSGFGAAIKESCRRFAYRLHDRLSAYVSRTAYEEVASAPWMPLYYNGRLAMASYLTNQYIPRINLVTDSIDQIQLMGGVATSLILATVLANRLDLPLRIITRTTPAQTTSYFEILSLNQIKRPKRVTFFSDSERGQGGLALAKLEVSAGDVFIATSWWSAADILKTTVRPRIFYIIQEVESFFYPRGDEHYLCSRVMESENIDFLVNSSYLFDYFESQVPNIAANGIAFEPAFPMASPVWHFSRPKRKKYRLFFYARPGHPRNLYAYGINILNQSIAQGVLDMSEWEIHLAGAKKEEICFVDGSRAVHHGILEWREYKDFLREVDLALALMYSPHPSYLPFDVAASGGVVITNKCMNKTYFLYSDNVILSELDEELFLKNMENAIALAQNHKKRMAQHANNSIPQNWHHTLEPAMLFMEERLKDVSYN